VLLLAACAEPGERAPAETNPVTESSDHVATDGRLAIRLELSREQAILRFESRSDAPLRIYLPASAPFRGGISTVRITVEDGRALFFPEPRPHGYVVGEDSFPLLAPGERFEAAQPLALDGVEPGRKVTVDWTYENRITRWPGGRPTMDGPTRELFGGGDIPHIWTGRLALTRSWMLP